MAAQEKSSFYDRLGGVSNMATVVDDLTDRVMVDERLKPTPGDEAYHRASPARFKLLPNRTGVPADHNSSRAVQPAIRMGTSRSPRGSGERSSTTSSGPWTGSMSLSTSKRS